MSKSRPSSRAVSQDLDQSSQTSIASPIRQAAIGNAAIADGMRERDIADEGVEGAASELPFLSQIQASFGPYDVTGVAAHFGEAAQSANEAMGANAYATGHDVAFNGSPSLATAAEEATHVIQQASGLSIGGGVGTDRMSGPSALTGRTS